MRLPLTVFLIVVVLGLCQAVAFGPSLSDPVASSFDGSGRAHAWQSRSTFRTTHVASVLGLAAVLGGSVLLIRFVPTTMMNVPHRDYYLAPERREATVRYLCRHMLWFGSATMLLVMAVIQLTIDANLSGSNLVSPAAMWMLLGPYFAYVVGWLIAMFVRFRKPAASELAPAPAGR